MGISPTGYFTCVSKLWIGNISDRYITEKSGPLEKLEEGDSVMADKGFNIRDLLTRKKVAVNIRHHFAKVTNYPLTLSVSLS